MQNRLITVVTLSIGALGGWCASLIGFPSPWLLGAMISVLLASASGFSVYMPSSATTPISWILGVSLASGIDSDITDHILMWSLSLGLMLVMLGVSLLVLYHFYTRFCRWGAKESLLAAVPGNLNVVMIFAAQEAIDVKRIAMVHSLRIFAIVSTLPLFFPIVDRVTSSSVTSKGPLHEVLMVILMAGIVGEVARRIKVPAGMLLGSLATTLAFKFVFAIHATISPEWFHVLLIVLGTYSAVRSSGVDLALLLRTLKAGLGGVALTLLTSGIFSVVLYAVGDITLLQALLAYLPGGVEIAIAIAFSTDVDPVFVATHQVSRVVLMSLLLPVVYQLIRAHDRRV